MKKLLRTEQLAQLAICIMLIYSLPVNSPWWVYLLLFFAPDLGIIGYAFGTRVGGWIYNMTHLKLIAGIIIVIAYLIHQPYLMLVGLSMWGHSSMDRLFGYGLKHEDSFQHTHLGWLTKAKD